MWPSYLQIAILVIPRLHDEAGSTSWLVQLTYMLDVCLTFARCLLDVCSIVQTGYYSYTGERSHQFRVFCALLIFESGARARQTDKHTDGPARLAA